MDNISDVIIDLNDIISIEIETLTLFVGIEK